MSPEKPSAGAGAGTEHVVDTDDDVGGGTSKVTGLRLASAVMFVTELDRSVTFYEELLGWHVTVSDNSVALLVGPEGFELYLRAMGPRTQHPLGFIGIQYLNWTATDEADLRRCEDVLRRESSGVSRTAGDGFTLIEGHGPDGVPVMVTYPGPDQVPRHEILRRIYEW
jgi:catechol 2,3-dioxygenase-like lactoylglutathione lyase family enzyme